VRRRDEKNKQEIRGSGKKKNGKRKKNPVLRDITKINYVKKNKKNEKEKKKRNTYC
jgi:hypothetical protein